MNFDDLWHVKNMPPELFNVLGGPVASSATTLSYRIAMRPDMDRMSIVKLLIDLDARVEYHFRLYRTKKGNWMKFVRSEVW
jgi:hypothetical protein